MQDLVGSAQSGDADAFAAIVARKTDELHRLASAIVGRDDAADMTQETLLQAWRELPRLRDPARFDAWLRAILVNRCRNLLRSRTRRIRALPIDLVAPFAQDGRAPDPAAADRPALDAAFGALTPEQRIVVVLHYVLDLSQPEVAATLGIAEGTVKSRLSAALQKLRSSLEVEPR